MMMMIYLTSFSPPEGHLTSRITTARLIRERALPGHRLQSQAITGWGPDGIT
jgi:hypothetical protein